MVGDLQRRTDNPSRMSVRATRLFMPVAGYALAVLGLRWAGSEVWSDVAGGPRGPLRPDEAVELGGVVLAWACLIWWGVAYTAAVLCALPGAVGRSADACAARIAPAAIRRLARYTLGAALVTGTTVTVAVPAGAVAAAPAPTPRAADPDPASTQAPLSLDRPTPNRPIPDANIAPAAQPITSDGPRSTGHVRPQVTERKPPAAAAHRHGERTPRQSVDGADLVVRAGDTLWGIAARHLPAGASNARIATEWPRWYRANADVVGADPDLIRPGQQLRSPLRLDSHSQENR